MRVQDAVEFARLLLSPDPTLLAQFDTFMHPGEICSIKAEQFITPKGFAQGERCAFLLHPLTGLTSGKTGDFDESVVWDENSTP